MLYFQFTVLISMNNKLQSAIVKRSQMFVLDNS